MTSQAVTFTLPRALLINANDRNDRWTHASMTRNLRTIAKLQARRLQPTGEQRVHITVTYTFHDRHGIRDISNAQPSSKALVDGICDAGVLLQDDDAHVLGPDNRLGTPDKTIPVGRVRVTITLQDTE